VVTYYSLYGLLAGVSPAESDCSSADAWPFSLLADGQSYWCELTSSFLYRSVKRQVGSVKRISIPSDKKFYGGHKSD
jgi:hypothetical protein